MPFDCSSFTTSYSDKKKVLSYHFFFDNLFTSFHLLSELQNQGYNGTDTLHTNCLEKNCPLKSQKCIDNLDRDSFHCITGVQDDTRINVTRWNDNAVATIASTLLQ